MRAASAVAVVLLVANPAAGYATESLGALLNQIAPPRAPQGSVEVMGWVERDGGKSERVVTLTPTGAAKLVGAPGDPVTPNPRAGVAWAGDEVHAEALQVEQRIGGGGYLQLAAVAATGVHLPHVKRSSPAAPDPLAQGGC